MVGTGVGGEVAAGTAAAGGDVGSVPVSSSLSLLRYQVLLAQGLPLMIRIEEPGARHFCPRINPLLVRI